MLKLEDFPIIEEPKDFICKKVHVDGWLIGCVFILKQTEFGVHILQTPKLKRFIKPAISLECLEKIGEK
jgi:hypothetical protein